MGTEVATMVLRGAGVVACLLVALASGANPDGEQAIAQSINEAIDAQMQDAAAAGKGQAATAMADLAEYTHGTKSHRWEKRAIAAIRGMSQTKMAVSDLSDTELKFAKDTEEAKDIMDQTAQAASLDEKQRKQEEAASIKAQLAKAQETLTRATHESEELGESDDDDDDSSDIDTHTEEDPSDRGPMDGGVFLLEDDENDTDDDHDDFEPALSGGTSMEVAQDVQSAILQQTNLQLNKVQAQTDSEVESGLASLTEDTENAQAAIQEMKARLKTPQVNMVDVRKEGHEEAEEDAHEDNDLGSSQAASEDAHEKAKASKEVAKELEQAQAKLLQAQSGLDNAH